MVKNKRAIEEKEIANQNPPSSSSEDEDSSDDDLVLEGELRKGAMEQNMTFIML